MDKYKGFAIEGSHKTGYLATLDGNYVHADTLNVLKYKINRFLESKRILESESRKEKRNNE